MLVAIDFDGVIADKRTGTPIEGAQEGVRQLKSENEVIVFTARHDLEKVRAWLEDHDFPKMKITNRKPSADVYLDDHAVRFEGNWNYALRQVASNPHGWSD